MSRDGILEISPCEVTRFYAPLHTYQSPRKIHRFDAALREAFKSGSHDKGFVGLRPIRDREQLIFVTAPSRSRLGNALILLSLAT